MKKLFLILFASALLVGCGSSKKAVEVVDRVQHDTLYLNKVQYDSIYRNDSFVMDYHPSKEYVYLLDSILMLKVDTMYIHDKQLEYKYKYLHDTTYVHRVDSVPVVKQVEVVKTEKYVPWYTKTLAWIGLIVIILFVLYVVYRTIKFYLTSK